jgi:hypothetical protein
MYKKYSTYRVWNRLGFSDDHWGSGNVSPKVKKNLLHLFTLKKPYYLVFSVPSLSQASTYSLFHLHISTYGSSITLLYS